MRPLVCQLMLTISALFLLSGCCYISVRYWNKQWPNAPMLDIIILDWTNYYLGLDQLLSRIRPIIIDLA